MPAAFSMTVDPARQCLRIAMSGFFDPAHFAAFDAKRRDLHARLATGPDRHDVLVDVRDLQLQAQATVETARAMIADRSTRVRRVAFVTGDAAIRMQVRRLLDRDGLRCFATIADAEAWLDARAEGRRLAG